MHFSAPYDIACLFIGNILFSGNEMNDGVRWDFLKPSDLIVLGLKRGLVDSIGVCVCVCCTFYTIPSLTILYSSLTALTPLKIRAIKTHDI